MSNQNNYLKILADIVAIRSPYTEPVSVDIFKNCCKDFLTKNLKDYRIIEDAEKNIIAIPNRLDSTKELIYLSAHIDTVPADESEWDPPFHPYKPYVDNKEIVGRGVNDCKAGVAFILYAAQEIAAGAKIKENIAFTLIYKEEGPGKKTSQEIAKNLGATLPVHEQTTFLVLENTLSVVNPPYLGVYTTERSSYAVSIDGTVSYLSDILRNLSGWNPVAIMPLGYEQRRSKLLEQVGGHVCTRPREQNLLYSVILDSDSKVSIQAGDEKSLAVIPSKIFVETVGKEILHRMIITLRDIVPIEKALADLEPYTHRTLKPFNISAGLSFQSGIEENSVYKLLLESTDIESIEELNPGCSDATIIHSSLALEIKDKIHFIVAGPGCRSKKDIHPPRMTHGVNETFFIEPGIKALELLERIVFS